MNLRIKIELIIGAIIVSMLIAFYVAWKHEKKERKRQETNVSELTKTVDQVNIDLTLTRKEFKEMKTQWANQMDSAMKASNVDRKTIKELTELATEYRDSIKKMAKMGKAEPIKPAAQNNAIINKPNILPAKTRFKRSFSEADSCFSVAGNIYSYDPESEVEITDRGFSNKSWLFVNQKRFLNILWRTKKVKITTSGTCGQTEFKHIKFVK